MSSEKQRNIAYGERWEVAWMAALMGVGATDLHKVHVSRCAREGDVHCSIDGHPIAFELQVAREHNDRYSWTGKKLKNFSPDGRAGIAILGCPGRSRFSAIVIDDLVRLLEISRMGDFSSIQYNSEYDFYLIDPEALGAYELAGAPTINELAVALVEELRQ